MVVTSVMYVNGLKTTDNISLDITSATGVNNSASSFKANFNNERGRNKTAFTVGDEIFTFADDTVDVHTYAFPYTFDFTLLNKLFTGIIEDVNFTGKAEKEKVTISGRDFTARLQDATVEPVVYNDTEVSVIVKDIISNNVSDITTTFVDVTTTTLGNIAFNHTPVFDALKKLADLSGFYFFVDSDKVLHFKNKGSIVSGSTFDNTNIVKSIFKTTDKEIANKVWVYGGRQLAAAQNVYDSATTEKVDGGSVFTLTYKPYNTTVFVNGGSVPKIGGILNMQGGNLGSPLDYLIDFHNRKLIFVSGATPGFNVPASGTASEVVIDYQRSVPIVKFGQDNASISTYGVHSKVIADKNIDDPQIAEDQVTDELSRNSQPKKQGNLTLNGLFRVTAGETAIVDLPYENINTTEFDMLEVKYKFNKRNNLANEVVTVKVANRIADVTDTIKQLILDVKQLQAGDIDSSDVLTRLENAAGSYGVRISSWYIKEKSIDGDALIWGSDTFGKWGSLANGGTDQNWRASTNVSFILGHTNNGVLGTSPLGQVAASFVVSRSGGTFT